jgi:quinol monooxygenase YgiN
MRSPYAPSRSGALGRDAIERLTWAPIDAVAVASLDVTQEVQVTAYGVFGRIVATAGDGDALAGHLLDAASALEDVEGCHLYAVSRDPSDPEAVWVVEFWESAEAHRASLELSAVQELISRARPIIAAMGERIELQPIGGKGVDLGSDLGPR